MIEIESALFINSHLEGNAFVTLNFNHLRLKWLLHGDG